MKKAILIFVILAFSISGFSQEMVFKYQNKWIDFGIWEIPQGSDTTILQDEWRSFFINDTIVENYFETHPEKYKKEVEINDSTVWINRDKYRWMLYENLSRQVQVNVYERTRKVKMPTQAEIDGNIRYAKIVQLLKQGYEINDIRHYIDSAYYNIDPTDIPIQN